MTLINNEKEYRKWMVRDFFETEEGFNCIFTDEELEEELCQQTPKEFPCIALVVEGSDRRTPSVAQFFYRDQIEEWAKAFGIIPNT